MNLHKHYQCFVNFIEKRLWQWCLPVNFAKFLRAPILWNTTERLLLYIARLTSTWRKVYMHAIYWLFIWPNYVRSIKTKEMLLIVYEYEFKIKFVIIFNYEWCFYASRVMAILLLLETVLWPIFFLHQTPFTIRT